MIEEHKSGLVFLGMIILVVISFCSFVFFRLENIEYNLIETEKDELCNEIYPSVDGEKSFYYEIPGKIEKGYYPCCKRYYDEKHFLQKFCRAVKINQSGDE